MARRSATGDSAARRRADVAGEGRERPSRLAAPLTVGGLTAAVTALTLSLDLFELPGAAQIAVTAGVTALAGVVAWVAQLPGEPAEDERPARGAGIGPPAQLPPGVAHFTGRADTLAELRAVFEDAGSRRRHREEAHADARVVSIHGPAGVGKSALATRFAREIAGSFPDGQLYFDLRGGEARVRPEEVLTGFLLALGVRLTTDPGGLRELQMLWRTWVRGRRILVYLDNAQDAEQVQDLIPPEPGCAVLVTSRQPLYLRNTSDRRLREFTESQGIELLARLAGDERVAADLPAAVAIVDLCGRLPLAISICGGRLAARETWTLREMADRLADERRRRLDELEIAQRLDQSVRASLQLSYDDCTETQRRLLRSFGLLAAPDVQGWVAGELLGVSELEGDEQLEALVDAQLVEYSGTDRTGATRFRLHDLVRLYARERADKEDAAHERQSALERVVGGYGKRAEQVAAARWPQDWHRQGGGRQRRDPGGLVAMDWLTSERMALLALLGQATALELWEQVWRLGRASCSLFHSLRVFWTDWREAAEATCLAAERTGDPRSIGIARLERAAILGGQGQIEQARADAREALEIFQELRERWWAARATRTVGMTLRDQGNLDEGQRHLLDAIAMFRDVGDEWWHARTQRNLGELRLSQRRYEEARELLEESLEVFRRNGNEYSRSQTLRALGEVLAAEGRNLRRRGDVRAADAKQTLAAASLERAAESFRLRYEQWEEARCLRAAGEVGDPRNGLRELAFVRRAEEALEGLGDTWGLARTQLSEGRALGRLNRDIDAVDVLRRTVASFRVLDDRWWEARSLRTLAEVLLDAGRSAEAREPAEQALEIYRSLGNEAGVARARDVLARTRGEPPPGG